MITRSITGLKSGMRSLKDMVTSAFAVLKQFIGDISKGTGEYHPFLIKCANTVKVFIASTRKFLDDDCLTKASSIAYTTIVSLVPTLTVALTFYSVFSGVGDKKDELFNRVSLFMLEHNIKLNIDPVFAAVSGLIDNARTIGGIGAVVMIFSATAMLRSLESSLNNVWAIKTPRPMYLKIIYYSAVLILGPVMLLSATTVATMVSGAFSSPSYSSMAITEQGHQWLVGTRASILHSTRGDMAFAELAEEAIDLDNQKCYELNETTRTFDLIDFRIEPIEFKKLKFTSVQFMGKKGWISGNGGVILLTENSGKTWNLRRWGTININDMRMIDPERGFAVGDSGVILETSDGARTWTPRKVDELTVNLNSLSFNGNTGIITANRGTIIMTSDGGKTWDVHELQAAKKQNQIMDINRALFAADGTIWLMADNGIIIHSTDGGKTWESRRFRDGDYYAGYFKSGSEGYAAGENGIILYTSDGGETWRDSFLPTERINTLIPAGNELWAVGDAGLVMKSINGGETWKGLKGSSGFAFLNFLAPFVFIWLLFLLAYMWLPNTRIPFREASLGAAFTATVWVIFLLLFIVYVKSFASGTFAVYGALASIPLFLLMIYASCVIILYGAEVSYTLMHPATYMDLTRSVVDSKKIHVFHGVSYLNYVYGKFESGRGASRFPEIVKACGYNTSETEYLTDLFLKNNLLVRKEDYSLMPANSSSNVRLTEVIDLIHAISMEIPPATRKAPVRDYMNSLLKEINAGRGKIIGNITLKDIISRG